MGNLRACAPRHRRINQEHCSCDRPEIVGLRAAYGQMPTTCSLNASAALYGQPEPMRILAGTRQHPARGRLKVGVEGRRVVRIKVPYDFHYTVPPVLKGLVLSIGQPCSAVCARSVALLSAKDVAALLKRIWRPPSIAAAACASGISIPGTVCA